ncbi:hypothetical protein IU474_06030 [Nocardia otitidiscaviarum]|uniref:hypothetical protein n=1 Tax=Nocardia otitidiscaviarum TaxID=1823 RepID=UPI001895704E|nr:hypothetical protein [Nocardia otitidiscaviarum]MBF6236636.1 hypothetical protein [Nocardia otitidiscaviarum]
MLFKRNRTTKRTTSRAALLAAASGGSLRGRSTELDTSWIWALEPARLHLFLTDANGEHTAGMPAYLRELRELALHLIIESPSGPPTGPAEFIASCRPDVLARNWGGSMDATSWGGVHGYDVLINAVTCGKFPALAAVAAEFTNLFRRWTVDPHAATDVAADIFGDTK